MAENINVNPAEVESASERMMYTPVFSEPLSFVDEISTVSANQKGKDTYADAVIAAEILENAMKIEAERIKDLGQKFKELDALMDTINRSL